MQILIQEKSKEVETESVSDEECHDSGPDPKPTEACELWTGYAVVSNKENVTMSIRVAETLNIRLEEIS